MAKLIPPIYVDTRSRGEERIFANFKDDNYSKDWVVLHSFDLPQHSTQGEGEVDFVVLIPKCGVLCVEIKASSSLGRKSGLWRYGEGRYYDPKGPFKQVKDNTYSLMRRIKSAYPQMRNVPFFDCVIFTNFNFRKQFQGASEWSEYDFLDEADLNSGKFTKYLHEIFLRKAEKHGLKLGDFVGQKFDSMQAALRPDFDIILSPKERILNAEIEAKKYTQEQYKILDGLAENPRIVVDGLAGTGKTLLSIEYARRVSKNENILFLSPTKELSEFIADESRLEAPHFVSCYGDFLEKNFSDAFDVLIIDEAQDFIDENFYTSLNAALKGGLENGKWIMFGDFFLRSKDSQERLKFLRQKYKPTIFKLSENCRNPFGIARLVEIISGAELTYSEIMQKDNSDKPEFYFYETLQDETKFIAAKIESLKAEGVPLSSIAIVSLDDKFEALSPLLKSKNFAPILGEDFGENKIFYGSLDEFKGMEADFILLTDLEKLNSDDDKRKFYLGATRAKFSLSIFANSKLKTQFERTNYI